jgi:hypothetical protein
MELKNRKLALGENLDWTDYLSLSFTQDVNNLPLCLLCLL